MIRNLWSSVVLFVLGELLSWVPSFSVPAVLSATLSEARLESLQMDCY